MRRQHCLMFWVGVFSLCVTFLVGAVPTRAEVFTIDSSQSQITLSGKIEGLPFTAQGPGGLTAAYEGNINATVSGSTIQFTGSSMIAAITNGVWQPAAGGAAGSAPADYGAKVTILFSTSYGAGRNIVIDLTSPPLTLAQTNFDSSQVVLSLVTNADNAPVFDYNSSLGSGSLALSGNLTNTVATGSSFSTNGDLLRLVVQINATLTATNNSVLTMTGKIVATNSLLVPVPPVITGVFATNQNLVLTVSNATTQSQLLMSTNLSTWSPVSATISTNGGFVIFTTPMSSPSAFYRIQN
jgi:hypothetical protein